MGYIKHDGIIVTSGDRKDAEVAAGKATALGLQCTSIVESRTNGYASFLIIPDGSKEGWEASEEAEKARSLWKAWAEKDAVVKDHVFVDYAHVRFGGDDEYAAVISSLS